MVAFSRLITIIQWTLLAVFASSCVVFSPDDAALREAGYIYDRDGNCLSPGGCAATTPAPSNDDDATETAATATDDDDDVPETGDDDADDDDDETGSTDEDDDDLTDEPGTDTEHTDDTADTADDDDCVAQCNDRECGADGCGGVCGVCGEREVCIAGTCEPAPPVCPDDGDCTDRECGPDPVCGVACGECTAFPNSFCDAGSCSCTPNCADKDCGDDGCGGSCGTCAEGSACSEEYDVCMRDDMVFVPSGPFFRGCNALAGITCESDRDPYQQITLSAFMIDKTEVTVSAFSACVDARICAEPATFDTCNWNESERDDHPVNCVDWYDAKSFCTWVGKRLPTEAEWEKAARGTEGLVYPWGNNTITCSLANYDYCVGRTTPVGSYPLGVSPYGALDMIGNASEWVSDWYSDFYYDTSPTVDPQGPTTGVNRAMRAAS